MKLCRIPKKPHHLTLLVCACGCGEPVKTGYNGKIRFRQGHAIRLRHKCISSVLQKQEKNNMTMLDAAISTGHAQLHETSSTCKESI